MPFKKPYRDFQKGDLIYGLKDPRADFITDRGFSPTEGGHTIDNYSIFKYEFSDRKQLKYKHPKDQKKFVSTLKKHEHYSNAFKDESATEHKCKGGLYWATFSKKRKHVHFLLDELDLRAVVLKSNYKGRSITASELRWVYRFREYSNIQENIQFWLSGAQCPPPWEGTGQRLWAQYIPKKGHSVHGASLLEAGDELDLSSFQDELPPSSGLCGLRALFRFRC